MISTSLNHCMKMGAEPGRRFLKQPAAKLEPVIVAFDKERLIPAAGAFHWSWHQLKNFERQGMTYELFLEIFSMEKLNNLLYCNCSVNFFTRLLHFTLPPELTWVGMLDFFRCTLRSVVNHVIVWDRNLCNKLQSIRLVWVTAVALQLFLDLDWI